METIRQEIEIIGGKIINNPSNLVWDELLLKASKERNQPNKPYTISP